MNTEFLRLVSYNRFIELQQQVVLPLVLFLKTCRMGECTGIRFIDSTTLKAPCLPKVFYLNQQSYGINYQANDFIPSIV